MTALGGRHGGRKPVIFMMVPSNPKCPCRTSPHATAQSGRRNPAAAPTASGGDGRLPARGAVGRDETKGSTMSNSPGLQPGVVRHRRARRRPRRRSRIARLGIAEAPVAHQHGRPGRQAVGLRRRHRRCAVRPGPGTRLRMNCRRDWDGLIPSSGPASSTPSSPH